MQSSSQHNPDNNTSYEVKKADAESKNQMNQSNILQLPEDMLVEIFAYLKPQSSVALTCSLFNKILNNRLWPIYLKCDFPEQQDLLAQKNVSAKALYQSLCQDARTANLFFVLYAPSSCNDMVDYLNRTFPTKKDVIDFINIKLAADYHKLVGHHTRSDAVANARSIPRYKVFAVGFRFSEEIIKSFEKNGTLPLNTSINVYPKEISEKDIEKTGCTNITLLNFNEKTQKFESRAVTANADANSNLLSSTAKLQI